MIVLIVCYFDKKFNLEGEKVFYYFWVFGLQLFGFIVLVYGDILFCGKGLWQKSFVYLMVGGK